MPSKPTETSLQLFPQGHPLAEVVADALVRAQAGSTLVDLYDGLLHLRLARAQAAAERQRERERLDVRGELLLRTVESARAVQAAPAQAAEPEAAGGALQKASDPLAEFLAKAEDELAQARGALEERARREEEFFAGQVAQLEAALRERVDSMLAAHRPALDAVVQPVGREHALIQVTRPAPDDAVLIGFVLSGKLFTRYDAFFDDAIDDLSLEPARFYAEEGNPCARLPDVDAEDALCAEPGRAFVPAKGHISFRVPGHDFPRYRLVNRGPVAEVQARAAGGEYAPLMPRAAAELLSGYLLRLKLEGRLEVALRFG